MTLASRAPAFAQSLSRALAAENPALSEQILNLPIASIGSYAADSGTFSVRFANAAGAYEHSITLTVGGAIVNVDLDANGAIREIEVIGPRKAAYNQFQLSDA